MNKLGSKKIGKAKYPDKTSINLMIQDRSMGDPKFQILLFILFLLILGVFVKFMVVDKLTEAYTAQKEYEQTQALIMQMQEANRDYDKIREEYSHYGNGYLNDEEKAEQDRMVMLNVIKNSVITRASIQSVEISGNVATLTIDGVQLKTVSDIVASVEDNGAVSYVSVSTAGTETDSNAVVTATMIIHFNPKGGDAK